MDDDRPCLNKFCFCKQMIEPPMTSDSLKVSAMKQGVDPPTKHAIGKKLIDLLEFKYAEVSMYLPRN